MARDYKQGPVLTAGEVAHFLSAQAETVRWWSELSVSQSYRIEPTGWLTVRLGKVDETGRCFSLPIARVGRAEKDAEFRRHNLVEDSEGWYSNQVLHREAAIGETQVGY